MEETDKNWGGKREGAGRKKSNIQRKRVSIFVSDNELALIKQFIEIAKKDPQKAKEILSK